MTQAEARGDERLTAWPDDGLERVAACPVCGIAGRALLHADLIDNIFFAAPGTWTMWRCDGCRSAYLDPRPTRDTIGIAYGNYYTHVPVEASRPTSAFERFRMTIANGYRNARYGTARQPAVAIGGTLARLVPRLRLPIDTGFRHLPRRPAGVTRRVLDIGCGNG
ncbi:MAG: hypothetical protein M3Q15_00345, partial [Pseudomonadota bacterium]|nr:hypothetical protein [Pseudomonadota bacterium]